uniref:Retrovirus-related Pol polyprotein from transposon TNT 1-94 n=1 Tax=Tanacetum cinerariifolium TaxID=118510 RepID=A0A699H9Y0_TANCI|nr:retrovirus-related Pol polyprotein from transposon TNT 1-94 [Tanacetum cinerariifolium]
MESSDKDIAFYKRGRRPEQNSPDMGPDYCGDIVELFCGGRNCNGTDRDYVSQMPRGMFMDLPTAIRAVSFREIDGFLYVALQTREIRHHGGFNVNSMNYVYAYCIATGQWVDRRVDHPIPNTKHSKEATRVFGGGDNHSGGVRTSIPIAHEFYVGGGGRGINLGGGYRRGGLNRIFGLSLGADGTDILIFGLLVDIPTSAIKSLVRGSWKSRIDIEGSFDRVFVEEEDGSFFGFSTIDKRRFLILRVFLAEVIDYEGIEVFKVLGFFYQVVKVIDTVRKSSRLCSVFLFIEDRSTKFDVVKFDGTGDFALWKINMKALLTQHKCESALLATKPTGVADMTWDEMLKSAHSALILCLGDRVLRKHIDEFHKLVGDLAAIDTAISDKDQVLLLLTSLPSSYGNFVETLLYGRETLKLEDEHLKMDCPKYNQNKSQDFVKNKDHISGFRTDGYDSTDVMMVMSIEQLLDCIIDSDHMTCKRDYLLDFEKYDGGFTVKMQSGMIKVIKGSLVVLSRTRRANYVYTLDGQAVTRKTFKGRKKLGEFLTEWKIKTGNVLDSCNQRGLQKVQTQDLIDFQFARDREQHSTREIFRYREDNNEAAFTVTEAEKIYAHELLTFKHTVAYEVISKRKTRLKEGMDDRLDVCTLSNDCKESSDDMNGYY